MFEMVGVKKLLNIISLKNYFCIKMILLFVMHWDQNLNLFTHSKQKFLQSIFEIYPSSG